MNVLYGRRLHNCHMPTSLSHMWHFVDFDLHCNWSTQSVVIYIRNQTRASSAFTVGQTRLYAPVNSLNTYVLYSLHFANWQHRNYTRKREKQREEKKDLNVCFLHVTQKYCVAYAVWEALRRRVYFYWENFVRSENTVEELSLTAKWQKISQRFDLERAVSRDWTPACSSWRYSEHLCVKLAIFSDKFCDTEQ